MCAEGLLTQRPNLLDFGGIKVEIAPPVSTGEGLVVAASQTRSSTWFKALVPRLGPSPSTSSQDHGHAIAFSFLVFTFSPFLTFSPLMAAAIQRAVSVLAENRMPSGLRWV